MSQSISTSYYDALSACGCILHIGVGSLDGGRLVASSNVLQVRLVKLELTGLIFGHVGKVEADADEITLGGVVALIIIVIDDHLVTVILSSSDVLEVVKVERVGEDIVRVDALEGLALGLRGGLQALKLAIGEDLHLESVAGIVFLLLGPLAVLSVKGGPVVVDIFVELDVTDLKAREALVEELVD